MYLDFISDIAVIGDFIKIVCKNQTIEGTILKLSPSMIAIKTKNDSLFICKDEEIEDLEINPSTTQQKDDPAVSSISCAISSDSKKENETDIDNNQDDDDDSENEDSDDINVFVDSEITELSKESMDAIKNELKDTFDTIFAQSDIKNNSLIPTNATIIGFENPYLLAKIQNGNIVKINRKTLIGNSLCRDDLKGTEVFCANIGAPSNTKKCKKAAIRMTYEQLRSFFYEALELESPTLMKKICQTMINFPDLSHLRPLFAQMRDLLKRFRTFRSAYLCQQSLSDAQKQELKKFLMKYDLNGDNNDLRSTIMSSLGIKVTKAYIFFVESTLKRTYNNEAPKTDEMPPLHELDSIDSTSVEFELTECKSAQKGTQEQQEKDALEARIHKVFQSVSVDMNSTLPTNAILIVNGIGSGIKAQTDEGKTLNIQGDFFIGNPMSLITGGIRVFTKPQATGKCYVTIEEMTYGALLEYCHNQINEDRYQDIANIVKGLRSIPAFSAMNDELRAIYNDAKQKSKIDINKNIRTYTDLTEDEKSVVTAFVKELIANEDTSIPLNDFQIANAYNEKFGVLLHTSTISTIRKDLNIANPEARIRLLSFYVESNCQINKYFAFYNNGAAFNDLYSEIRFRDDVVDPVLLTELKKYKKGDPPIPAVCGIISGGSYAMASFIVAPGLSSIILQTAKYFEAAGNKNVANAIKAYLKSASAQITTAETLSQSSYISARDLRLSHEYSQAEEVYLELIESNYQLDTVVKDLADMYREMGKLDSAIELMEKYVEKLDGKQKAFNFIVNLYSAAGDYEKSVYYLRKLYDLIPTTEIQSRANVLLNVARQYILLGEREQAKLVLSEASRLKAKGYIGKNVEKLLDKIETENDSAFGKLTHVLSFKAPALLEKDMRLENFQHLSEEATQKLLKAKEQQNKLDQKPYRKQLIQYARTRYEDLLKCGKCVAAQEYMICVQTIYNLQVDSSGMLLLLSQIENDPIELIDKQCPETFQTFLSSYSPERVSERILLSFLRCFDKTFVLNVIQDMFKNDAWRNRICNIVGHDIAESKLFRDLLLRKIEQFDKIFNDVCTSLDNIKQTDDSYAISKQVLSLLDTEYVPCMNEFEHDILQKSSEIIQAVNYIQTIDDYQVVEDRTSFQKKAVEQLKNQIVSQPTRITSIYVIPILDKCNYLLEDNLKRVSKEKSPSLNLISVSNARVNNDNCCIQLKLSNKIGHSKILSAVVRIVKINGRDVTDKQYIHNQKAQLPGGSNTIFEIAIELHPNDIILKIIQLEFDITYYDKDNNELSCNTNIETRIDDSHDFEPYPNAFAAYANAQEVYNRDMVKGRDSLLDTIADNALYNKKNYLIWGQRRSGKSTVLYHVAKRLRNTKKCFVAEMCMSNLTESDEPNTKRESYLGALYFQIFSYIKRRIKNEIKKEHKDLYKKIFESELDCMEFIRNPQMMFDSTLDKIRDFIQDELGYEEDRIILIIDEFTNLYRDILLNNISSAFIEKMKGLSESGSVTFIVSGHDVMPVFWEQFPNEFAIFKKEPITSIAELDARKLVEEPVWDDKKNKSRFEANAVSRIIEMAGYSPFYIQIICNEVVDYANNNKIPLITEYDVNKVITLMTSSVAKLKRGDFDNLLPIKANKRFHEKVFCLSLDNAESILKEISRYEDDYVSESSICSVKGQEKKGTIDYLISRNVLTPHPEYGRKMLKFQVPLFKEWLRKNELQSI